MQRRSLISLVACAVAALALPIATPVAVSCELSAAAAVTPNDPDPRTRRTDMSSQEEQIRSMIETGYPGFVRAGDAAGYAGQFTDDALWMPPGETDRKGPKAIAETLGAELEVFDLRPTITVREVSIVGDHAWVVGEDEIEVLPKDGGDPGRVVYTVFWLLRKMGDEWKIARQIWNEKPAS